METALTRLVGCRVPLQQAGMGGTATAELVTAVADAGAIGMLGLAAVPAAAVAAIVERVASATSGVFGANFLIPFLDREAVAVAAAKARVVELFYGDPDASLVELVHSHGALACWQVGSLREALAAADAGCDLLVAQGNEAGGHVRGTVGLLPLLDQTLGAVDLPVIAAGGIGSARAFAAVLAAGAAGARIGTRFVAAEEANTHQKYAEALLAAEPEDTVVTTTFGAEWPDATHRVLQSAVDAANATADDIVGQLHTSDGQAVPLARLSVMPPGRTTTGAIEAMALYAGQSVGSVHSREPAAAIVRELADGAERLLGAWR
ncbi:MAG: NAD(P)H-dependent flavin oxidoreductase [Acidimicrobiales bacterium]